jgi:hypothetical protein
MWPPAYGLAGRFTATAVATGVTENRQSMLENSSAVRPSSEGRPPRVRSGADGRSFRVRSRSTNDPRYLPKQPNPRAQDRRRCDLITAFVNALGGPEAVNDLAMLQVRRCAELQAMCEMARAGMLNGTQTDMLALVRLEGVAARAVRALGIKTEPVPKTSGGLTIARRRWEEQRAQEQAKKAREASATNLTEPEPPDGRAA